MRKIGEPLITEHAERRVRERVGVPKRGVRKNAALALERGVGYDDAAGALRRYIAHLYELHEHAANNIRIYNSVVYIFAYDVLITVLQLPPHLRKIAVKLQREKSQSKDN